MAPKQMYLALSSVILIATVVLLVAVVGLGRASSPQAAYLCAAVALCALAAVFGAVPAILLLE